MYGHQELGLNNGMGNETYERIDRSKSLVIEDIKNRMIREFNVTSQFDDLPLIYWTVKFHKSPVKFRPIAGSKNKVLSPLESIAGCFLKRLTSHFQNYSKKAEKFSGFKHYFAIKNSQKTINILSSLNTNATSFDSFDFSNLYTNFNHEFIIERLNWLVDLLFNHSAKTFINVSKNLRRAEYNNDHLHENQGWSFDREDIKSIIKFLIENTYIEFGRSVLHQKCGVPMGSIPAPDLANLALSVDEFRFVQRMRRERNIRILRKMNHM